ncbi:MAG: DUF2851 family protein [Bacteroidota bacterium]
MQEKILHYIWSAQFCSTKYPLYTTKGKALAVIKPGVPTQHGGPDFHSAHIRIENIDFYGSIEIHTESAAWYKHGHNDNSAYQNIILHVVWKTNQVAKLEQQAIELIPTLELSSFIDQNLITYYQRLMSHQSPILCRAHLSRFYKKWEKTVHFYAKSRLQRKASIIIQTWKDNNEDSNSTAYQLLSQNFGFKANSSSLLALSKQIPIQAIHANHKNLSVIEALLLGQAGFVSKEVNSTNKYKQQLSNIYQKLSKKYKLKVPMKYDTWNFCQLRPANFPTIRIAQLATILSLYPDIFHFLINLNLQDMYQKLAIHQSPYWQSHYLFGKESPIPVAGLGKKSICNIVINTVVPLLVAYGALRHDFFYLNKAIQILHSLPAEDNAVTRKWKKEGINLKSAFESQGAIELFQQLCASKKCAYCPIGKAIIE